MNQIEEYVEPVEMSLFWAHKSQAQVIMFLSLKGSLLLVSGAQNSQEAI